MGEERSAHATTIGAVLDRLTASKESIRRATRTCMDVPLQQVTETFNIVVSRIAKSHVKQRLALFYLVDSLCQSCHARLQDPTNTNSNLNTTPAQPPPANSVVDPLASAYLNQASDHMPLVVSLVCPTDPPPGTQHQEHVIKVLKLWISRKIFPQEVVLSAASNASLSISLDSDSHHLKRRASGTPEQSPRTPSSRDDPRKHSLSYSQMHQQQQEALTKQTKVVLMWSLDDALLAINLLASGRYADKTGKDVGTGMDLSDKIEKFVELFADQQLFFGDVEHVDQTHIDALASFDDGRDLSGYDFTGDGVAQNSDSDEARQRLAYRYRIIRNLYQKVNVAHLLSPAQQAESRLLQQDVEDFLDNWLATVRNVLSVVAQDSHSVNCIVSSNKLVLALAKCVLFSLTPHVPVDCVYSASKEGKVNTLVRIVEQHGPAVYYFLGGEMDTEWEPAANQLGVPFLTVATHTDLKQLESQVRAIKDWRQLP